MEITAVGWERNRQEHQIARINVMEASVEKPRRVASKVFLEVGDHDSGYEGISIHFKEHISLNSDYAVQVKIDRREIARLFLLQHKDVPLSELVSLFEQLRRQEAVGRAVNVDDLQISVRAQSALEENGIKTVATLVKQSAEDLLSLPRFDRTCLGQVKEALEFWGLRLSQK